MTVASYFNTAFRRIEIAGVTDVQTVVNTAIDEITNQLPVGSRWTNTGVNTYKTPPQDPTGSNRWFEVVIFRSSATRMGFQTKDKNGSMVYDGRIDISGTATARVWCGPYHLFVEMEYGSTTYEDAFGVMLDPTPFGYSSIWPYVAAYAYRSSAGVINSNAANLAFMLDSAPTTLAKRIATYAGNATVSPSGLTSGGASVILPVEFGVLTTGSVPRGAGKLYQCAVVPYSYAAKTSVTVPLDVGTTGEFEVLGRIDDGGSYSGKFAVRKA